MKPQKLIWIVILITFLPAILLCNIPVKVEYEKGKYIINAEFEVNASQQEVWNVLTDYETIDQYISYIKETEKIISDQDTIYIQQGVYHLLNMLPVNVYIELRITEYPYQEIHFQDISNQDFEFYKGYWKIVPDGETTAIFFQLEAVPKFLHLNVVTKNIFQSIYSEMTSEIRQEILTRYK